MAEAVKFPVPGCVVEFLEDNAPQIGIVLESLNGRLRVLLPSRREVKIPQTRLLPWLGPIHPQNLSREDYARALEAHKKIREEKASAVPVLDVWELAQGEVAQAGVGWLAELVENEPDMDTLAAYGRALLACKTHFRFQPPDFLVFDRELVDKRLEEQNARAEREAFVSGGATFLRGLWDRACGKRGATSLSEPDGKVAARVQKLLFDRMINPDTQEDAALWQLVGKGLPDVPHLPIQLLMAWGKLPPHYNFWLDRAGYDRGDDWWRPVREDLDKSLASAAGDNLPTFFRDLAALPFISIDSAKTRDIDDSFHITKIDNGWRLTVALACPAHGWSFGSGLDRKVIHRATSIYLPEGDLHMLPEIMGTDAFSLRQGEIRPALCMAIEVSPTGEATGFEPFVAKVRLADNLTYDQAQEALEALAQNHELPASNAAPHAGQLAEAASLARARENYRIARGAIVMRRPDQKIVLEDTEDGIKVDLIQEKTNLEAQRLVSEMMVLASSAFADWAVAHNLPLIFRTQNVTVPRDYAGIWERPEDITRVMRALAPSILETAAKPHAALATAHYAPITSPLRRYADLANEAQALHFLANGKPLWTEGEIGELLDNLSPGLDAAGQVQRFRPRYWKLLYFRQAGDRRWWDGVITEENENFISVSLPGEGFFARGRRSLFDERACPGMNVRLRLGKINPLYNEIQIIETQTAE